VEECDDGNNTDGDGCDALRVRVEPVTAVTENVATQCEEGATTETNVGGTAVTQSALRAKKAVCGDRSTSRRG
jgi:hypothetical protein